MSKVAEKRFKHPRPVHDFRVDSVALLIDIGRRHEAAGFPAIPQAVAFRRYWQYLSFLQSHAFTSRIVAASSDEVTLETELRNSDLTDEGFRFVQYSHDKWLDRTYKDSGEQKEQQFLERWFKSFELLRAPNKALQTTRSKQRASERKRWA